MQNITNNHPKFLPWYNIDQIAFLEANKHKLKTFDVFEYGGGNSTLYYLTRVKSLYTVESREVWFNFVKSNANKINYNIDFNIDLVKSNFAYSIKSCNKSFDLIVVDSNERAKCIEIAPDYLNDNGWILLDNSERENLKASHEFLKTRGFSSKNFSSKKVESDEISYSTLFIKEQKH
jgi:tRNA A58 N-methylase Trm61